MNLEIETMHYTHDMIKLKLQMRKLWTDHAIFTRMFIVDFLGNLSSIDYTTERLLKNQDQIGNCFREFFGDVAADSLTLLLREHITIAADLLKAIKSGDTSAESLEGQWAKNAEDISTLLATIAPCYSKDELIETFNTHLILVKYQFIARMDGDYNADVMYFDMGLNHILRISDYLTDGLIGEFFSEQ